MSATAKNNESNMEIFPYWPNTDNIAIGKVEVWLDNEIKESIYCASLSQIWKAEDELSKKYPAESVVTCIFRSPSVT